MNNRYLAIGLILGTFVAIATLSAFFAGGFISPGEPEQEPFTSNLSFEESSVELGLDYSNERYGELHGAQNFMGTSGVYATDYNDDLRPDILLLGEQEPLLLENTGNGFTETDALPSVDGFVRSALFFDMTGNGKDDLLLLRMYDTPVLLELRDGEYVRSNVTIDLELDVPVGAAAADFTGNGCLDLFIIQNGDLRETGWAGSMEEQVPLDEDNGQRNYLVESDCDSMTVSDDPVFEGTRWSLATSAVDYTGNGWPDIHIANDYNRDILYHNTGGGEFERIVFPEYTNRNGMSSEVADVSGDGRPDIFITNIWFTDEMMEHMRLGSLDYRSGGNNLLVNEGNGEFSDQAKDYGIYRGGWGWASVLEDFDNDGDLDLFHTTSNYQFEGRAAFSPREAKDLVDQYDFYQYPVLYAGENDTFEPVDVEAVGFDINDGRGVAELDATGNGKLDLLVGDTDGHFALYRNDGQSGNSLILDVERADGTPAIGAELTIETGDETRHRWVTSNNDWLSQGDPAVHVGVGGYLSATVTITWQDGTEVTLEDLDTNYRYRVDETGVVDRRALD